MKAVMLILIKTCCFRTNGPGSSPGIFNTNTKISEGWQTSNFRPRRLRFEPNERELSQLYGTVLKGKRRFQKWGIFFSYAVIILNPLILTLDKKKKNCWLEIFWGHFWPHKIFSAPARNNL